MKFTYLIEQLIMQSAQDGATLQIQRRRNYNVPLLIINYSNNFCLVLQAFFWKHLTFRGLESNAYRFLLILAFSMIQMKGIN